MFVKGGKTLKNDYGASEFVTNNQGLYFLQYPTELLTKSAYEAFLTDSDIEIAILNRIAVTNAIPGGSWGTDGNGNSMGIQAGRMKNYLKDNENEIIVAVADTGADVTHPHLQDRIVSAWGYDGTVNDISNHGTHVAGTVVECTPNNVKIMPVKVLNNSGGMDQPAVGDDWSISVGIKYAVDNGAKVINMSLGWVENHPIYQDAIHSVTQAIEYAEDEEVVVVVSAGNENTNTDKIFPAQLSVTHNNVITVAAVDQFDLPAYFSNYGDAVIVCAPGYGILSSLPGGKYGIMNGTSMAAPHVSAAVAMLFLEYPDYTSSQIKELLKSMTVDLGTPGWDKVYGTGRVDFRMFDGPDLEPVDSISATSFSLRQIFDDGTVDACTSITMNFGTVLDENTKVQARVFPKEATDKSVSYTTGSADISVYQDGKILPKGFGSTVIYARKGDLTEQRCIVNVIDNWINHAAETYAGGSGTEANPYLISTAPQLAKMAYETRVNKERYNNTYFKLTDDIDLSGYNWTPIGAVEYKNKFYNDTLSFAGVFDGNGHVIENMWISIPKYRNWEYRGLFGFVRGYSEQIKAEIKNVAVLNATIGNQAEDTYNTGILCGTAFYTNISNCYTEGISSGAGLVGWTSLMTIIKNCYSDADTGRAGLVDSNYASILNSFSTGTAGIAGFVWHQQQGIDENMIKNSVSLTVVDKNSDSGFIYQKNGGSIIKCYYPSGYTGINSERDDDPTTTNLISKGESFFKTKSSYTTASNWDASSPWDFDNVWDMDANYNDGLPFLQMFRTYNIEYNAGGYNVPVPAAQVKRHGESLTLSTEVPSREGYDFVHWNTKPDGTGTAYSPGAAFTANANTTLYAIWRINHYTITYYANGGYNAPSSQMATMNTSTTLSLIKPTKVGRTFLGWTPSPVATEPTYYAGQTITLNSSLFLYAVWRENAISAGNSRCLLLDGDGKIWSWGRNSSGQLGDGSTADNYYPVPVDNLFGVVAVAGGGNMHSLALQYNGTVWAWGGNSSGQIGDGSTTNRTTPTQVSNLGNIIAIAAGNSHSLALREDGTVWAWGSNSYGQLGDETTTKRTTPVQVSNLTDIVAISAGSSHSLALKSDGTVWAWGYNSSGQLGDGTTTHRLTPTQVLNLTHVTSISTKGDHSMAIQDSSVWTWGSNTYGQLGDGTTTKRLTPVKVNIENVVAIAAGGFHSLIIKSDGTVWGWGRNQQGQLGDNTTTNRLQPVQTQSLNDVISISAGINHSIALQSDGNVWTWGYNVYGQLGDGSTINSATPQWVWQE